MPNYFDAIDDWREKGREVLKADPLNISYPSLFRRKLYVKSGEPESSDFDQLAREVFEWLMERERDEFVALIPKPPKKKLIRVATPRELLEATVDGLWSRAASPFKGTVQKRTPRPTPAQSAAQPAAVPVAAAPAQNSPGGDAFVAIPKSQVIAHKNEEQTIVRILVMITGILSLALWLLMAWGGLDLYEPLAFFIVPAFGVLTMVVALAVGRT